MRHQPDFTEHLPLVGFTWALLLAAGLALGSALPRPLLPSPFLQGLALGLGVVGGSLSFLHLGQKARAAFALRGITHSWLSREAMMAGGFAGSLMLSLSALAPGQLAGAAGVLLAVAIAALYRLEARPGWSTPAALAAPVLSVLLLGSTLAGWKAAILIFGLSDLAAAQLRQADAARTPAGLVAEFPHLRLQAEWARRVRGILALCALALALFGRCHAASALQALTLLLDRLDFYADARMQAPHAAIAALKRDRMKAACVETTELPR